MLGWIETSNSPSSVVVPIYSPTSNVWEYQLPHILAYSLFRQHFLFRVLHLGPLIFGLPSIFISLGRDRESGFRKTEQKESNSGSLLRLPTVDELTSSHISQHKQYTLLLPSFSWCWLWISLIHLHTCSAHFRPTPGIPSQQDSCALEKIKETTLAHCYYFSFLKKH